MTMTVIDIDDAAPAFPHVIAVDDPELIHEHDRVGRPLYWAHGRKVTQRIGPEGPREPVRRYVIRVQLSDGTDRFWTPIY